MIHVCREYEKNKVISIIHSKIIKRFLLCKYRITSSDVETSALQKVNIWVILICKDWKRFFFYFEAIFWRHCKVATHRLFRSRAAIRGSSQMSEYLRLTVSTNRKNLKNDGTVVRRLGPVCKQMKLLLKIDIWK